ncbi:MAG: hypothetical protein HOP21_02140 [Methylotenera sp.]|nr:hypothetical protein [Methylotenera sp.]
MKLYRHHLLRSVVFIMLAVFVMNTVYASGEMALMPNTVAQQEALEAGSDTHLTMHCHDNQHSQGSLNSQASDQKSHTACNGCHHCFACFSVIFQSVMNDFSIAPQLVLAHSLTQIYLSPTHVQPQKPPIAS